MDFRNVEKKYRPIPFWSWNEKLDAKETARQIDHMDNAGMGGYFMHARGGLQTEYMSEEWFDNVATCIKEGKKRGMGSWAYDENGWPSGSGNGEVCKKGVEYQQKHLRIEIGEKHTETTICNVDGYHIYYVPNEFYIDVLSKKAVAEFIKLAYVPYYERFGSDIVGFFTDEPQICREAYAWSFEFPDAFKEMYGEDLIPLLPQLFYEIGDYKNTRIKFWKMSTDLFSQNYAKQIYDFCDERGLKFTGHLNGEESLISQLRNLGSAMPHYEYFHIPGIDWLGRDIYSCLTPYSVGSAAAQLGKEQVISETFALCGHNVSFGELKGLYEWQMAHGINLLCQHLQGYSIRGLRKRDYPPAMYIQQPWWNEYEKFNYAVSLEGKLFSEGREDCVALLILPMTTAWALYNGNEDGDKLIWDLNSKVINEINLLNSKHILFHLGDETLIKRHGKIESGKFVIGNQSYSRVILMDETILLDDTESLFDEFVKTGGLLINSSASIEANNITDNPNITYAKRVFDDFDMHFFLNATKEDQDLVTDAGCEMLNILTGETEPFIGECTLKPNQSVIIIGDYRAGCVGYIGSEPTSLIPTGKWQIKNRTHNAMTLDRCDYYFDGELVERDAFALDIQINACNLKRRVDIRCDWHIDIKDIPSEIYLGIETPEIFNITINGEKVDNTSKGNFIDKSIIMIDIAKHLKEGENIITTECDFVQSEDTYAMYERCIGFEGIKNRFTYDMEIEPMYLIGDFGVKDTVPVKKLDRNAERMKKGFAIVKAPTEINLEDIQSQGFRFFAGEMTLTKKIMIDDTNKQICLEKKGINAIKVKVNGGKEHLLLWDPLTIDLSKELVIGENEIEITIINNLRNLMGPHHLDVGECYQVGPASFYKNNPIWKGWPPAVWNEDYCFVETGISFRI
ncbi:MAG: hypothetical protein PHE51_07025 [Eubacteriales bacterium]|nr:hypothetical protein [Eubacteriales bacterium]